MALRRGTQGTGLRLHTRLAAGNAWQLEVRGRAQFLQASLFTIDALDQLA